MAAEAIGVARKNAEVEGCTGRLDILNADPFDLPFEEETFQLTTCAFGLTFEEDLEDVLDEMFRVTDYMGRVFIVDADFTRAKVTPAGATGLVFAPETLAMMKELGYGKLQVSRVDTLRDGTVINLLAAKRFDPEGEEGDGDDENDDGKDAE